MGGWGKPPVDEVGRPLYGDVFGVDQQDNGKTGFMFSSSPRPVYQASIPIHVHVALPSLVYMDMFPPTELPWRPS